MNQAEIGDKSSNTGGGAFHLCWQVPNNHCFLKRAFFLVQLMLEYYDQGCLADLSLSFGSSSANGGNLICHDCSFCLLVLTVPVEVFESSKLCQHASIHL